MRDRQNQKNPYPLGAQPESDGIRFSFVSKNEDCGVLLYDAESGEMQDKIAFSEEDRIGNIYCRTIRNVLPEKVAYQFYSGENIVPDEHARVFVGKKEYGKEKALSSLRAGFLPENYEWEEDRRPGLPYNDVILYCMHVRGFTKHSSSGVAKGKRGTFAGIEEKIPYLKEIGITTLELQPAYEFMEIPGEDEREKRRPQGVPNNIVFPFEKKINYWGYKKGYYYAPKAAYAASEDVSGEFKSLVKALHANHMELVMQFYFPNSEDRNEIAEILRFWAIEYHVDGFHLMGENLPIELLASDNLLADRKLMYYEFRTDLVYQREETPRYPHLAEYRDDYLYDIRKFLKGDENMLGSVLRHLRHIPEKAGNIHYLTNYYGFTLADLVSFEYKHNEANGEENRDGNDYNCSWNCGEEGASRSRKVRQLRVKQIKNAMCMVLLTQSTPLIFMGDEFGNSQMGNNNPWCQDNVTAWLDWNLMKKNENLLRFWKQIVTFREQHPIIHPERELRLMDYVSCGYPDLSYHGESAWRPQMESYHRHIGIMLCGKYAKTRQNTEDDFIYIAMNMHWESHRLALPRLPKGLCWQEVFSTLEEETNKAESGDIADNRVKMMPRSINVYVSVSLKDSKK